MPHPSWYWPLRTISHPAAIVPLAVVVAAYFGRYSPAQITELQEVPLFLQGTTDMGGSDLFSGTLAMYVALGALGSIYAVIHLAERPSAGSYQADLRSTVWALKYHIILFILGGVSCWSYDSQIGPNDFRNMFVWTTLVYVISVPYVVAIARSRAPAAWKVLLAPLFIYLWLILGWDGNTMKAGQVLSSHVDPAFRPRGVRHRVMLEWHRLCDRILGDI